MKKIVCIGSATKDIFLEINENKIIDNSQDITAKKLVAFELGAKVYASHCFERLGGSAVNVAAGLTKAGMRAFVFSRVKKGETGDWIIKKLGKMKVKKNYLQKTGNADTAVSVIVSDYKNQDRIIFRAGDSVQAFDLAKAISEFKEKVNWIYLGSQKNDWQEKVKLAFEFAKLKKAKLVLSPSSWQISNEAKKLVATLKNVQILFLNRDEAIELIKNNEGTAQDNPKDLVKMILSYGVKIVAMTDGAAGAYAGDKDGVIHLSSLATKVKETVGAGDAFCSGFLASYIEKNDIKQALAWGIANSAGAISQIGGTEGLLTRKEMHQKERDLISQIKNI